MRNPGIIPVALAGLATILVASLSALFLSGDEAGCPSPTAPAGAIQIPVLTPAQKRQAQEIALNDPRVPAMVASGGTVAKAVALVHSGSTLVGGVVRVLFPRPSA